MRLNSEGKVDVAQMKFGNTIMGVDVLATEKIYQDSGFTPSIVKPESRLVPCSEYTDAPFEAKADTWKNATQWEI